MNAYAVEQLAEQHYRDLVALAQAAGGSRRRPRRARHNPLAALVAAIRMVRASARLTSQTRSCTTC